jgi:hypothetical protein
MHAHSSGIFAVNNNNEMNSLQPIECQRVFPSHDTGYLSITGEEAASSNHNISNELITIVHACLYILFHCGAAHKANKIRTVEHT